MPRVHRHAIDRLVAADDDAHPTRSPDRHSAPESGRGDARRSGGFADMLPPPRRPFGRADGRKSFKCGRCRVFVGPTVSGGRHRNHCPLCLTSRHVDLRRPGDRASPCRALMAPIGVFSRPKGEQVVFHRCLGCALERHNRVAADDNPLALLRLPPVAPRLGGRRAAAADEAIA